MKRRTIGSGLVALAFSAIALGACGGSVEKEAKSPQSEPAPNPEVGSKSPDPAIEPSTEKAKTAIAPVPGASAADGSDIIPPFPSSGTAAKDETPAAKPVKAQKKSAKPKKKKTG
jgi:hypothetical protein